MIIMLISVNVDAGLRPQVIKPSLILWYHTNALKRIRNDSSFILALSYHRLRTSL